MLSSLWLLALTIGLLIVASAFFSSAETALTAASDARMRQLVNKGNKRAKIVETLRADRDVVLAAVQQDPRVANRCRPTCLNNCRHRERILKSIFNSFPFGIAA